MTILLFSLIAANTTTGVAAQYVESEWGGNPLYCDTDGTLFYDIATGPWVAMPIKDKTWRCGDWIQVSGDGWSLWARALDSGNLHTKTFRGGQPVVVDVPEYFAKWATPLPIVSVTNWSAVVRECKERGYCD